MRKNIKRIVGTVVASFGLLVMSATAALAVGTNPLGTQADQLFDDLEASMLYYILPVLGLIAIPSAFRIVRGWIRAATGHS